MNTINHHNMLTFKASRVNITSIADCHGDVLKIPQAIKAIQMHGKDLFERASDSHSMNLLAITGDYFMNPKKKGFLQNPEFCAGDIQYNFLSALIYRTKMVAGIRNKFEALFTIGNHDLDGGDEWLFDKLAKAPMTTVMTNINRARSPLASNLLRNDAERFVTAKVIDIPDSIPTNEDNHLLVLGITIPSMNYYNPGLLKKTAFYNNSSKNDAQIEEKDIRKTIRVVKNYVKLFKEKYPQGAVMVLSHAGNKIASMFAENVPEINLILNGHDHKEFETLVGNTLILSHGQGSAFLRGTQLQFDNNKKLTIRSRRFDTEYYEPIARKDKKIQDFVNVNLRKDLIPLVKFDNPGALPEELVLDDSIRYADNLLAKYITSGVKESLRKRYPDIAAVGIPSTIFRNGLKSNIKRTTLNNMDFLKIFDGVNENQAKLKIGTVTGKDIYNLVLENVLNNLKSRTRNALIQWSDIQINRSLVKSLKDNLSSPELENFIKIRNPETGKFEKLVPDKEYRIALSDKYLLKATENIRYPEVIRDKFEQIDVTYDDLFREYLESINFNIKMTAEARETRIL